MAQQGQQTNNQQISFNLDEFGGSLLSSDQGFGNSNGFATSTTKGVSQDDSSIQTGNTPQVEPVNNLTQSLNLDTPPANGFDIAEPLDFKNVDEEGEVSGGGNPLPSNTGTLLPDTSTLVLNTNNQFEVPSSGVPVEVQNGPPVNTTTGGFQSFASVSTGLNAPDTQQVITNTKQPTNNGVFRNRTEGLPALGAPVQQFTPPPPVQGVSFANPPAQQFTPPPPVQGVPPLGAPLTSMSAQQFNPPGSQVLEPPTVMPAVVSLTAIPPNSKKGTKKRPSQAELKKREEDKLRRKKEKEDSMRAELAAHAKLMVEYEEEAKVKALAFQQKQLEIEKARKECAEALDLQALLVSAYSAK